MTADRDSHAHEAVLAVTGDFDDRAPGGAVTVALCGALDHEPPCPLAPHHTSTSVDGTRAVVRVVFACHPADEPEVRRRIDAALSPGELHHGPAVTRWTVLASHPSPLAPGEPALGARLAAT